RGVLRLGGGPDNVRNTLDGDFRNEGTMRWEGLLLLIRAGSTFRNTGLFEIDVAADVDLFGGAGPAGMTVLLNEGTLRKQGAGRVRVSTDVTNRGRLAVVGGTFALENVGHLNEFVNEPGGTLSGTGLLDLSALAADHLLNDGVTAPGPGDDGAGVGALTIAGPLPLGGALYVDLEGTAPGQYDRLVVSGGARELGSTILTVRPTGGFVAAPGQTFDVIEGEASGAPVGVVSTQSGVDFEASLTGAGVRLTAIAGGPGSPIFLTPAPLVSGGVRTGTVGGAGLTPDATVALVCVACVDPEGLGRIVGEVVGSGPARLDVRFDLSPVGAYGDYELVVEAGGDSLRTPVLVEPYLALPLVLQAGVPGIPILPAPGARATAVNAYNATNSREPTLFLMRFERPAPQVRYVPTGLVLAPGQTEPPLTFLLAVAPSLQTPQTISFLTGVDPSDVRFPDEGPPAPGDPRLSYGGVFNPRTVATGALSPAQVADVFARVAVRMADSLGTPIPLAAARAAAQRTVDELLYGPPTARTAGLRRLFGFSLDHIVGDFIQQLAPLGQNINHQALADQFASTSSYITPMLTSGAAGSGGAGGGGCPVPGVGSDARRAAIERLIAAERARPNFNLELIIQLEQELGELPRGGGAGGCGQADRATPLEIRAAWDPNDKLPGVTHGCELAGEGEEVTCARYLIPLAEAAEPVTYTVRFENV
ncbi:MAG TPA: hypothetical protein VK610_05580, partial [Rhodothermales bacterium]|nr:hypothetical protein [Rhodothermales bacterium]